MTNFRSSIKIVTQLKFPQIFYINLFQINQNASHAKLKVKLQLIFKYIGLEIVSQKNLDQKLCTIRYLINDRFQKRKNLHQLRVVDVGEPALDRNSVIQLKIRTREPTVSDVRPHRH